MMQSFILMLLLLLSILFSQMKHPLSIGLMLLIQTLWISLLTGLLYKTFWFSYILFLIFMGGMLVLFIYVTALASKEMFFLSMKLIMFLLFFTSLIMIYILIIDKFMILNFINLKQSIMLNLNIFINENILSLNKLYNFPSNYITFLLIIYLFFTLIVTVKITNFFMGPLRTMS
uniref:NADH-ubiquinone oxidoreductase chain 6 n=1 Tax=Arachnocampa flava TaxID=270899 RepID=G8J8G1_9DIPT|nr:NADH dehydrogenase subunit 6 [Arachnocampa flava]AET13079.1 NADH dehydrogenase subunit 6 [Arachnocampa flava]